MYIMRAPPVEKCLGVYDIFVYMHACLVILVKDFDVMALEMSFFDALLRVGCNKLMILMEEFIASMDWKM